MLILTRKISEGIVVGDDINIKVLSVKGNQVRIGIDAPRDINIARDELLNKKESNNARFNIKK